MTKMGPSETLLWHARAGQARRIADMLSPRDAELVEAYAIECEGRARSTSSEGAKVNNRRLVEIPHIADEPLVWPARSRLPRKTA
jgi:hypothetical protein